MTDTFNEGDLIEATKGEIIVRGRVEKFHFGLGVNLGWFGCFTLADLENRGGCTLTVIEKAAPALPTEPGVYITKYGKVWELSTNRVWWFKGKTYSTVTVRDYAPFTRLEPVADTAKKVLAAIESEYGEDYYRNKDDSWNTVAKQFGVSK